MPSRGIGLISLEGVPLSYAADRFIQIMLETQAESLAAHEPEHQ